jgi:DNA-directed RNA polymerase specialized sigma subunit
LAPSPLLRLNLTAGILDSVPKHFDFPGMIGEGNPGLVKAAGRFKADRGVKFNTYEEYVVQGAIRDTLRKRN